MDHGNIYRTIFEQSDIGVYQTLIEGGVVQANAAMARMFGYETPADFIAATGKSNEKFYVRSSDRDWHIAELKRSGRVSSRKRETRPDARASLWSPSGSGSRPITVISSRSTTTVGSPSNQSGRRPANHSAASPASG